MTEPKQFDKALHKELGKQLNYFREKVKCKLVNGSKGTLAWWKHMREHLTEEEISRYEDVRNQLASECMPFLHWYLRKGAWASDPEDLMNEIMLWLLEKALPNWDYRKGTLTTYLGDSSVRARARIRYLAESKFKTVFIKDENVFNEVVASDNGEEKRKLENSILMSQMGDQLNECMLLHFSAKRRKIFELHFGLNGEESLTQQEVGKIMGVSHQAISKHINSGLKIIYKYFSEKRKH